MKERYPGERRGHREVVKILATECDKSPPSIYFSALRWHVADAERGGSELKEKEKPHAPGHAERATMSGEDAAENVVPIARDG